MMPPERMSNEQETTESNAPYQRTDQRQYGELRPITFQNHIAPHATGSTLIEWGLTRVICAATIEDRVPRWMKEQNITGGWVTAEYAMLPYSTLSRKTRDSSRGKIDGRSQEIQRLIGRSMRAAVNPEALGARTIWIDCDVLQADGGTRTAAITGSFVALSLAINRLLEAGQLTANPILKSVAAVSVGVVGSTPLLDLCYEEDATAEVDLNIVMTSEQEYIELQGTGEKTTFGTAALEQMLGLARDGIATLSRLQKAALVSTTQPYGS
ncbi:MAG: Ribonuclease PH [Verrucomicrobia subdivision 3 bacterium]|nr:Ribonuclease PH [Limisphaerales bacterium]MCS1414958.1 Ribonuclease PH [Limisphaerales bacterium]